eukprot:3959266-Pleurochrysis_carterae.AAC.1
MSDASLRFATLSYPVANYGNHPQRNVASARHLRCSRLPTVLAHACLYHSVAMPACMCGEL